MNWESRCAIGLALWVSGLPGMLSAQPTPSSMPSGRSQPPRPMPASAASVQAQTRPAATDQLDESLRLVTGNNEPEARRMGARQLLQAGTDPAVQRLERVLAEGGELAAQLAVCEAVAATRRPSPMLIDCLVALLGDPRPGLSEAATRALGAFENGSVFERLRTAAADASAAVPRRLAAIRALGIHGDDIQAIEALATLAGNEVNAVQAAATAAMSDATGESFPAPADALAWWDAHKDLSAVDWLRRTNGQLRSRAALLARGRDELTRRIVSLTRADYTRTSEADRPRALLVYLRDDLAAIRELGLDLINLLITDRKEIGPDVRDRLAELIADPDAAVRLKAAKTAADLRMTLVVPQLLDVARHETLPSVRAAQVEAIGRLDDPSVIPTLVTFLTDDSGEVVCKAAMALGNLARRGFGAPADVEIVASELAAAFSRTGSRQSDIREQLLSAMALVPSNTVRTLFRDEIRGESGRAIRRASIRGLAAFRDAAAASEIRPLSESPDVGIRLASVDALGVCGESEEDLAALGRCLDAKNESDATVRERAWDSFKSMMQRAGVDGIVRASDRFAVTGDAVAQQRRLDLLKLAEPRLDELPVDRRIDALERMGDARSALGDYKIAAARFEQALKLIPNRPSPRYVPISLRTIAARLAAGDDDEALARMETLFGGAGPDVDVPGRAEAAGLAIAEMKRRLSMSDPPAALRLADRADRMAAFFGDSFRTSFVQLRSDALILQARARTGEIERLLDSVGSDAAAEKKLVEIGSDVLPPLHARLVRYPPSAASTQSSEVESRLISLAKRLAPGWAGYEPAGPPDARTAALDELAERFKAGDGGPIGANATGASGMRRSAGS